MSCTHDANTGETPGHGEFLAACQQSQAADATAEDGQLPLVDFQAAVERFAALRCQGRLSYMHQLESRAPVSKLAQPGRRLPPNVQPSLLQLKVCAGSNRLSRGLLPTCSPDGLTMLDPPPDLYSTLESGGGSGSSSSSDSSKPNRIHWQFGLVLVDATHTGPTGFGTAVQPVRHVARCCIFDRQSNRFLGNVHTIPATEVKRHRGLGSLGHHWTWDSAGPQGCPAAGSGESAATDLHGQQQPKLDSVWPGTLVGDSVHTGGVGAAVAAVGETLVAAVGNTLGDNCAAGLGGANACIVRCAELATDPVTGVRKVDGERLSIYVELNMAFRLMAEDAEAVPQEEQKGAGLVDELTTCWAMISLKRCAELVRDMAISVPLYTGSIYNPVPLSELWAEHRKRHSVRSIFSSPPNPQLTFRAGPLPTRPPPLLPYNLMPPTMIARRDVACLLAAGRLALLQLLTTAADTPNNDSSSQADTTVHIQARQPSHLLPQPGHCLAQTAGAVADGVPSGSMRAAAVCGCGDPVMAALPRLLDDPVLLRELLAKWEARVAGLEQAAEDKAKVLQSMGDCLSTGCGGAAGCSSIAAWPSRPKPQQLLAALQASVLELAPLLHCSSLPPPHISNFLEHQAHRAAVASRFCRQGMGPEGAEVALEGCSAAAVRLRGVSIGRHPVDVLSRAAGEFVHKPFDVSETRVCLAEQLAADRWSRC